MKLKRIKMKALQKIITVLFCITLGVHTVFSQDLITHESISPSANGLTGFSSAVSGGWAIVASPQKDVSGKKSLGGVTFFQLTDGQWKIFQEVLPSDISELGSFGSSLAIEGNTAVISAAGDHQSGLFSGAVYVYKYDYLQASWIQTAKLKASDAGIGKRFGHAVDLYNDMILVGSYNADGNEAKSGAAYVFQRTDSGWQEQQKITATQGKTNDYFGHQVHILDENHVAIGAYNADGAAERSGAVYIFQKSNNTWSENVKLYDEQGASSDLFGFSLTSGPRLNNSGIASGFPGILFIGAPGTNRNNKQTGSVYFYTEDSSGWNKSMELIEEKSNHNDHFGVSISCNSSGNLFVGSSRANTDSNLNAGQVFMYETFFGQGNSSSQSFELSANFVNAYDQFGTHVTTDDENIIIGSPYADTNGLSNSGDVSFFRMTSLIGASSNTEDVYSLEQNSPNPSLGATVIQYGLKKAGKVKISVYNLLGQLVTVLVDEQKDFGIYTVNFDTSKLESGVYVYKIEVNDFSADKKMVIGN